MTGPSSHALRIKLLRSLLPLAMTVTGLVFLSIVHASDAPYGSTTNIGSAAFFPGLISLLVTALGLALLISSWRETIAERIDKANNARPFYTYGLIVGLTIALPWLGIWLTAMLTVPLLAILFGERRVLPLLLLALVPAVLVIYLFEGFMGIYFPRGALF